MTRRNGWTPARRARQATQIHRWQPWKGSTGPRTPAGKARSSANAFKHGARSNSIRRLKSVLKLIESFENQKKEKK